MLQIISGKFFSGDQVHETLHRGVFYTNYRALRPTTLRTDLFRLFPSTNYHGMSSFTYEITEKIEKQSPTLQSGELISTSGIELVSDVSDVVSFIFGITCSRNIDLVRRLIEPSENITLAVSAPSKHLRRVFDKDILARPDDEMELSRFLNALIGLERRTFEAVIRSVRRYVTATHRIGDDLSLSYILLVMAIESLIHNSDNSSSEWTDYDESRRSRIDLALQDAPFDTIKKVQQAILQNEQVAVRRRFVNFIIDHTTESYFREESIGASGACGRSDLPLVLKNIYDARSAYVHNLREIPEELWVMPNYLETAEVKGRILLTFQGFSRLARHVILQFVERGKKLARENFDWRASLPGIIALKAAPQVWVHQEQAYNTKSARRYLSGFLNLISEVLRGTPGAGLIDIRNVLIKIEKIVPGLGTSEQRIPMLVLYNLYHALSPIEYQISGWEKFVSRYDIDLQILSTECVVFRLATGRSIPWSANEMEALHSSHLATRRTRTGLHLDGLFEAAFALSIAELYRESGDDINARRFISWAVEECPGNAALLELERSMESGSLSPIAWRSLLCAPQFSE